MSSKRVPPGASTQCAEAERRGCGTDVPEPSTVSLIIRGRPFGVTREGYQNSAATASAGLYVEQVSPARGTVVTLDRGRGFALHLCRRFIKARRDERDGCRALSRCSTTGTTRGSRS